MDADAAADWLGGEHGDPPKALPDQLQAVLLKGFEAGEWTEDEMPEVDVSSIKDVKDIWLAILKGSCDEAQIREKPVWRVQLTQWFEAMLEKDDGQDDTSKKVPSKQEKEDMAAQGMLAQLELRKAELSLTLGRVVSEEETAGGTYRGTSVYGGCGCVRRGCAPLPRLVAARVV